LIAKIFICSSFVFSYNLLLLSSKQYLPVCDVILWCAGVFWYAANVRLWYTVVYSCWGLAEARAAAPFVVTGHFTCV